jgi:hypothetical protein
LYFKTESQKRQEYGDFLIFYGRETQTSSTYLNRIFRAAYSRVFYLDPSFSDLYTFVVAGKGGMPQQKTYNETVQELLDKEWVTSDYIRELVLLDLVALFPGKYNKNRFDLDAFSSLLSRFVAGSWGSSESNDGDTLNDLMDPPVPDYKLLNEFADIYERDTRQFIDMMEQIHYFEAHHDYLRVRERSIRTVGSFWDNFGNRNLPEN